MGTKLDQIKNHFRENKKVYISIGIGLVGGLTIAGITSAIVRSNILQRGMREEGLQRGPFNAASFVFSNKQTISVTTVLDRDGRGHPGWPVRNLETKQIFFSQGEAARAFDVSESVLSGHLKGKIPDVYGLHFERVSLG